MDIYKGLKKPFSMQKVREWLFSLKTMGNIKKVD